MTEAAQKKQATPRVYLHVETGRLVKALTKGAALDHVAKATIRVASQEDMLEAGRKGISVEVAGS